MLRTTKLLNFFFENKNTKLIISKEENSVFHDMLQKTFENIISFQDDLKTHSQ